MKIRHIIMLFALFGLVGSVLFPGLDWLYAKFIAHREFVFHAGKYVIDEILFASIMTFLVVRWKKQK